MQKKAYLLLEDGLLIEGTAIGKIGTREVKYVSIPDDRIPGDLY